MTIAMCYLSPEGVVFGADSTASRTVGTYNYFNHNQKIFQIGEDSTVGILTWGTGGLGATSYRTLFAILADDLKANPASTMSEVAERWVGIFWVRYSAYFDQLIRRLASLKSKMPHDPNAAPPQAGARSAQEEEEFVRLSTFGVVGFCIGGHLLPERIPQAFEVLFDLNTGKPTPAPIQLGTNRYWGAPNIVDRVIHGYDGSVRDSILSSQHWSGSAADLEQLLDQHKLSHPIIPIRDAVDFVYSCIFSTIKALKFSGFPHICGGPIELAVITTDRRFRWIRHKPWDAALLEGDVT